MFELSNLFGLLKTKDDIGTKDMVAELLSTSPEALCAFEEKYAEAIIDKGTSDNFFKVTAKEASADTRTNKLPETYDEAYLAEIIERIKDELVSETAGFCVINGEVTGLICKKKDIRPVTKEELQKIPIPLRPMLTGSMYMRDLSGNSYEVVLEMYARALKAKNKKDRDGFYGRFRQGLEILDLDPVLYEILGRNRNSIGYWLPPITRAAKKEGLFKIPDTVVVQVPLPILQLTRLEYSSLNLTTLKIVDEWAMEVFGLDTDREYFIKTGVFSSKYDFRNAKVCGEKEVRELGEYLLFIQFQAGMYASPLNTNGKGSPVSIYGAATTNQFAVREFIADKEGNPCIYNGLPLHTEYRIFVEFGKNPRILGISPYWRSDIMKKRFSAESDADTVEMKHDYVIYSMHEKTLYKRYDENKEKVLKHIKNVISMTDLDGQWSIDVMQNENDFYIIDMALADTSAMRDCVPKGELKKSREDWIPKGLFKAITSQKEGDD